MKTRQPDETPIHDAAIKRALHFFLGRMGWNPSVLAREAGVSRNVALRAVLGDVPSLTTLRRLCDALGFDLWLFLLMGDLLSKDDLEHSRVSEAHTLIVKGVNRLLEAEGAQSTDSVMNEFKLGLRDSGRETHRSPNIKSIVRIRREIGREYRSLTESVVRLRRLRNASLEYFRGKDAWAAMEEDERLMLPYAFAGQLRGAIEVLVETLPHLEAITNATSANAAELFQQTLDEHLDLPELDRVPNSEEPFDEI